MNHQEHLKKLKIQQEEMIGKHQKLTAETAEMRDNILRVQGAIDYLTSVVAKEEEEGEEESQQPTNETEVTYQ
jgi:hypothetical protein